MELAAPAPAPQSGDQATNKSQGEEDEFLISTDPSKYVTLPVQYEKIWRKYQTTLDWFWTVHDVYLADDKANMAENFDTNQHQYILKVLAFMFTAHNTIITKELFMQLISLVDIKEAAYYFGSQADAKKTHGVMYSMLIDELLSSNADRGELISGIVRLPEIRAALKWCLENVSANGQSFARRLLAFATLQGIIFSAPFVMFGWIQKQKPSVMPGLMSSNKLIWRDEKLNLSFSCMLFEYIEDELEYEEAVDIVKAAVHHAKNIFTKALPVSILGMDCDLMSQYLEHAADGILTSMQIDKIYNKECPFDWVMPEELTPTTNSATVTAASFGEANFDTDIEF